MIEDTHKYHSYNGSSQYETPRLSSQRWLKIKNIILTAFLAMNIVTQYEKTNAADTSEQPWADHEQNEEESEKRLLFISVLSYLWDHQELLENNDAYQSWIASNPNNEKVGLVTLRLAKWVLEDPGFQFFLSDPTNIRDYVRIADSVQRVYPLNPEDLDSVVQSLIQANNNRAFSLVEMDDVWQEWSSDFMLVLNGLTAEYGDEAETWVSDSGISTEHIQRMEAELANQFPSESNISLLYEWRDLHGISFDSEATIIAWESGIPERQELVAILRNLLSWTFARGKGAYFFNLDVQNPDSWVTIAAELLNQRNKAEGDLNEFDMREYLDRLASQQVDLSQLTHTYPGLTDAIVSLLRAERDNLANKGHSVEVNNPQLSDLEILDYLWSENYISGNEELRSWNEVSPERRSILQLTLSINREIIDNNSFIFFGGNKDEVGDVIIAAEQIYRTYNSLGDTASMLDGADEDFRSGTFRIDFGQTTSYASLQGILYALIDAHADTALEWYYPSDQPVADVVAPAIAESPPAEETQPVLPAEEPVVAEQQPISEQSVEAPEAAPAITTVSAEVGYSDEALSRYQLFLDQLIEKNIILSTRCSSVQELATSPWGLWSNPEEQTLLFSLPPTHDQPASQLSTSDLESRKQFRDAYNQQRELRDPASFEVIVLVDASDP